MRIQNIIEIDDNLSKLTFGVWLLLWWSEPRIRITKKQLTMTHDFSRHCIWSPVVAFWNQIATEKHELIQNEAALTIRNKTDEVCQFNKHPSLIKKL